ncbi:MAG: oxygen-insensitive NADPH nitroreductase [Gammaproteobacteria bacterium]|nr:oxygen-insensitive NADPH nitroreductase [Gammaproteobacteria bacterium]
MKLSDTQELQLSHRSVRRFQSRPLDEGQLETLIRCGQAAATSSFIQAYSVVRVTRPDVRSVIAEAAGGQPWIVAAAEFLVFCADLNRVERACGRAGQGALEGFAEHAVAAIVDVALMAQNLLLAAESQGLGGVYIGGIRNAPDAIADQLGLPDQVVPVFGMCLGWPDEDNAVKPRQPVAMVLHQDRYRECDEAEFDDYDATMNAYYRQRGSNARVADWSSVTARAVQGKKREHMLGFLQARGFFRR